MTRRRRLSWPNTTGNRKTGETFTDRRYTTLALWLRLLILSLWLAALITLTLTVLTHQYAVELSLAEPGRHVAR